MGQDTTLGEGGRGFPETEWTAVLAAQEDPERYRELLSLLATAYWRPVYTYIRIGWRKSNEEAKDLTQAFFTTLLETNFAQDVSPDKGMFRSYLKACLRHFLMDERKYREALKRGGGRARIPMEDAARHVASSGDDPEQAFDRAWAGDLLTEAREAARAQLIERGRELAWQAFTARDQPAGPKPTYDQLAEQFGVPRQQVKSQIDYARQALQQLLFERVRRYCANEAEARRELHTLF